MKMGEMTKKMLRPFVPGFLLRYRARWLARRADRAFEGLSVREVFTKIYTEGTWGRAQGHGFFSGTGSHDGEALKVYVAAVSKLLAMLPRPPDVVDLGCGDFNVGALICPLCNSYVACDVVPDLIAHNKSRFAQQGVDFRCLDIVDDALPQGDAVFLRQVLQHLDNSQIAKVVAKLQSGGYKLLVVTEHLPLRPGFTPNLDKPVGASIRIGRGYGESGIVLTREPFNFRAVSEEVLCEVPEGGGVIRTVAYTLSR